VSDHLYETVDQVPDVGEVPGLLPGAGDREGEAVHRPVEEVRDDVPILAGDLPGAVGVEEPGVDDRQTIEVVEVVGVEFTDHLGDLVGGVELDGDVMFLKRHLGVQAVDATPRGGIDEPLDVNKMGILQNLEDPHAVDHQVFLRVVDRVLVGKVGGEVVDDIGFCLKRPLQLLLVQDVAVDELDVVCPGDVPLVRGGEVVKDDDLLRIEAREPPDQVPADGSGTAGDQHCLSFKE